MEKTQFSVTYLDGLARGQKRKYEIYTMRTTLVTIPKSHIVLLLQYYIQYKSKCFKYTVIQYISHLSYYI